MQIEPRQNPAAVSSRPVPACSAAGASQRSSSPGSAAADTRLPSYTIVTVVMRAV